MGVFLKTLAVEFQSGQHVSGISAPLALRLPVGAASRLIPLAACWL